MEFEFETAKLERLATDAAFTADLPRALVKAYRKLMRVIRAAPDEREFYALKGLHFEKLRGDRDGEYSMRLNNQFRLIIRFKGKSPDKIAIICSIEDYH